REQPDERDEEREDEALHAERPGAPRDDDERREGEPRHAAGRAAVAARGDDRERDRAGERGHVQRERGPDAAEDVRAVEEQLPEPHARARPAPTGGSRQPGPVRPGPTAEWPLRAAPPSTRHATPRPRPGQPTKG